MSYISHSWSVSAFTSALSALMAITLPQLVFAQSRGYGNTAAGGGIFACCGSAFILFPIAIIALNIALLVWVNKDAKSRGMDTPVVWMLVVLLTSLIGLIVYLLSRPKGNLVPCPRCGQKKLPILAKCPHCGSAV